MHGLMRFYVWYPLEIRVNPGSADFKFNGIQYSICIFPAKNAILSLDLDNEIVTGPTKDSKGYKYDFKNYKQGVGANQFASFHFDELGNKVVNLLMDYNDSAARFSKTEKYTQIKLYCEFPYIKDLVENTKAIGTAIQAIDHFIRVYRYCSLDTNIKECNTLQPFKPYIMHDYIKYAEEDTHLTFNEKVNKYANLGDDAIISPLVTPRLNDSDILNLDRQKVTGEIAHYLISDSFEDWQNSIARAYEIGNENSNFSTAILEAFLALEVFAFELGRILKEKGLIKFSPKDNLAKILVSIYPYTTVNADLIENLKGTRRLRNKIVHEGYQASSEEFEVSLKTINDILWDFSRVKKEYS